MKPEYTLQFHEALKRAAEDGVEIEQEFTTVPIYFRDGFLMFRASEGPIHLTGSVKTLMGSRWRVIEKPIRAEFEAEWFESGSGFVAPDCIWQIIQKFKNKRTRVIIEEIQK